GQAAGADAAEDAQTLDDPDREAALEHSAGSDDEAGDVVEDLEPAGLDEAPDTPGSGSGSPEEPVADGGADASDPAVANRYQDTVDLTPLPGFAETDEGTPTEADEPEEPKPAKKSRPRSKRASMPSWDEIVFGSKHDRTARRDARSSRSVRRGYGPGAQQRHPCLRGGERAVDADHPPRRVGTAGEVVDGPPPARQDQHVRDPRRHSGGDCGADRTQQTLGEDLRAPEHQCALTEQPGQALRELLGGPLPRHRVQGEGPGLPRGLVDQAQQPRMLGEVDGVLR